MIIGKNARGQGKWDGHGQEINMNGAGYTGGSCFQALLFA